MAQSLEEGHKFKTTHGNKYYLCQENVKREVVMRKIISRSGRTTEKDSTKASVKGNGRETTTACDTFAGSGMTAPARSVVSSRSWNPTKTVA